MKKMILCGLMLLVSTSSFASHLLGGYIQTTQRGTTDTVDVVVTLFTDPQGIANPTSISLTQWELVNGFYQSNSTFTISQQLTGTWQGVNVYVYSGYRVLSSGDYRFIYTNCCRGMLSNASSAMNSNFTIAMDYKKTLLPNSAPMILNPLPINWVNGDTAQSILFAVDVDGDSVMVEKDDAINQHSNNTFVPLSPFNQLGNYGSYYVDVDGTIQWAPNTNGTFGTGYKVSEIRNGQIIGVNRIQQVYMVQNGSTPNVPNLNPMITADLVNGDSLQYTTTISNATSTELVIPNVDVTQTSDSTWTLNNLQIGTYNGVLRASSTSSNMDYYITLMVNSTIGIEENVSDLNTSYEVYDWTGKYIGKDVNWEELNGLYIIKHSNGTIEKIYNI
jgi:hypothetical protein